MSDVINQGTNDTKKKVRFSVWQDNISFRGKKISKRTAITSAATENTPEVMERLVCYQI